MNDFYSIICYSIVQYFDAFIHRNASVDFEYWIFRKKYLKQLNQQKIVSYGIVVVQMCVWQLSLAKVKLLVVKNFSFFILSFFLLLLLYSNKFRFDYYGQFPLLLFSNSKDPSLQLAPIGIQTEHHQNQFTRAPISNRIPTFDIGALQTIDNRAAIFKQIRTIEIHFQILAPNSNSERFINHGAKFRYWKIFKFWRQIQILEDFQILAPNSNSERFINHGAEFKFWKIFKFWRQIQILKDL